MLGSLMLAHLLNFCRLCKIQLSAFIFLLMISQAKCYIIILNSTILGNKIFRGLEI